MSDQKSLGQFVRMQGRTKSGKPSGKKNKANMLDMDLKDILRVHALRYLPAKSLFRSLTVCRDWELQISTPFFVHNQSVSCRSFSGIFVQSPGNPPLFLSLDQMAYGVPDQELSFLPEPVDVKASANGLLCCVGRGLDKAYYVCNPVNRQWKKLPKPSNDHGPDPAIALVFEPSLLDFVADFKVVCVFASTDLDDANEFEIYSSHQDSWKVSSEMYFVNSRVYNSGENPRGVAQFGRAMYVDGVVYWPMSSGRTLSFDMTTQKAGASAMYGFSGTMNGLSGTMNGKPCMSKYYDRSIIVTLVSGKHGSTTMPLYADRTNSRTHVSRLSSRDVELIGCGQPHILLTWDNVVMLRVESKIFSHDLKTQETKALLPGEMKFDDRHIVLPYVNSLVALM